MEDKGNNTVIIIGAGLAGLSAALGFAKMNDNQHTWKKIIVVKKRNFEAKGATFGLAANGIKALKEITLPEVLEDIESAGIPIEINSGYMLPWYSVRDTLLKAVRQTKKIIILTNKTIYRIEDDSSSSVAKVYLENVDTVLEGNLIIAADGVHSKVRSLLPLLPGNELYTGSMVWRGTVDANKPSSKVKALLERGVPTALFLKHQETLMTVFNFHDVIPGMLCWTVSSKEIRAQSCQGSEIPSLFDVNHPDFHFVKALIEESNRSDLEISFPMSVIDFRKYNAHTSNWSGVGRVLLIGDASHCMRPASGQGGSMAFEDSAILYRLLSNSSFFQPPEIFGYDEGELLIKLFEAARFDRLSKLWLDQWERSEAAYKSRSNYTSKPEEKTSSKVLNSLPWSESFNEWVLKGI